MGSSQSPFIEPFAAMVAGVGLRLASCRGVSAGAALVGLRSSQRCRLEAAGALGVRPQLRRFAAEAPPAEEEGASKAQASSAAAEQVAPKPDVKPLHFPSEVCVYKSDVDLHTLAKTSRAQSMLGNSLAVTGFAGVLAGSPGAAPAAQALVCLGAAAMTYKFTVVAKKELALVALRQVEKVVILPSQSGEEAASAEEAAEDAASVVERLNATEELGVMVKTTNADITFKLGSPVAAWEGAKYSGLVADERPAFADVCRGLFHMEEISSWGKPGSPSSTDADLLQALLSSDKVVLERSIVRREDLEESELMGLTKSIENTYSTMLSGVTRADAEKATADSSRREPEVEIQHIGRSSLISGVMFFVAGMIFLNKEMNSGEDPTLNELFQKYKAKHEAKQAAPA